MFSDLFRYLNLKYLCLNSQRQGNLTEYVQALCLLKEYGLALKCAYRYFELDENPEAECYRIRAEILKKLKMTEECEEDLKMAKELEKKVKKK